MNRVYTKYIYFLPGIREALQLVVATKREWNFARRDAGNSGLPGIGSRGIPDGEREGTYREALQSLLSSDLIE